MSRNKMVRGSSKYGGPNRAPAERQRLAIVLRGELWAGKSAGGRDRFCYRLFCFLADLKDIGVGPIKLAVQDSGVKGESNKSEVIV